MKYENQIHFILLYTVAFLLESCATPKVAYFTDLKPKYPQRSL